MGRTARWSPVCSTGQRGLFRRTRCGSPRVTGYLRRKGRRVNRKRVGGSLRANGICGIRKRRNPRCGAPADTRSAPEDLVLRRFRPERSDAVVGGRHHLRAHRPGPGRISPSCPMSDLGESSATPWPPTPAPCSSSMPCTRPHPPAAAAAAGVIFHSDRGQRYLSGDFAAALRRCRMRQSTGRTSHCWDNGVVESFSASLKSELVSQTRFATRDQARRDSSPRSAAAANGESTITPTRNPETPRPSGQTRAVQMTEHTSMSLSLPPSTVVP